MKFGHCPWCRDGLVFADQLVQDAKCGPCPTCGHLFVVWKTSPTRVGLDRVYFADLHREGMADATRKQFRDLQESVFETLGQWG
jgi:hypothetical protein